VHIATNENVIGSSAASFKRPLLSVDVSLCMSVCPQIDAKYLGN